MHVVRISLDVRTAGKFDCDFWKDIEDLETFACVPLMCRSLGQMADDTLKANRRLLLLCSAAVRAIPGIGHADCGGTLIAAPQYIEVYLRRKS